MLRTAGPRSTTSGSPTRSRSTTRRSPRRSTEAGKILKNPKYVNGGFGDVKTHRVHSFQDAGLPILDGKCYMHRQASFYAANWPEGTKVGRGRRRRAPSTCRPSTPAGQAGARRRRVRRRLRRPSRGPGLPDLPLLGGVGQRAGQGSADGWVIGQQERGPDQLDRTRSTSCRPRSCTDQAATFRFDGSDLMPAAVGAGTFWKGMIDWITGTGRQGDARLHRELLAEELTRSSSLTVTPGHPDRGGADALRPNPVSLRRLQPE